MVLGSVILVSIVVMVLCVVCIVIRFEKVGLY